MLTRLHVRNFALVDDLTLEFDSRLNVLTGETGAGKSLLIDALRFVMGERLEALGKEPRDQTVSVEAVFETPAKEMTSDPFFSQFIDEGESLFILRRELNVEGKSKAWVNHRTVTLSVLKQISSFLIDIHGQYDHQVLLDANRHLEFVDDFGKLEDQKARYQTLYAEYDVLRKRIRELQALEEGREREMDLLKYQIEEIEKADLEPNEEDEIRLERIRLVNVEKLHEMSAKALDLLDGENRSVSNLMASALKDIAGLAKLDESLESVRASFENLQLACEEGIRSLRDYAENLSFDPDRLQEIETRLEQIDLLKRKYGNHVSEILVFLEKSKKRFDELENSGLHERETEQRIKEIMPKLEQSAEELSQQRKKAAAELHRRVQEELKDLQITQARFECQFRPSEFQLKGRDEIRFLISLNPGQPLLELENIISAGEVSRVMLAMKKVLMEVDPVPTLIFDEIDANIGGRLGTVTGSKLKEIAKRHQVLLITHLPQIASFADRHFKVAKQVRKGRTLTQYQVIEGQEQVRELAQMMSGKSETEISKKHAQEMLSRVARKPSA